MSSLTFRCKCLSMKSTSSLLPRVFFGHRIQFISVSSFLLFIDEGGGSTEKGGSMKISSLDSCQILGQVLLTTELLRWLVLGAGIHSPM